MAEELTLTEVLDALTHEERRRIIRALREEHPLRVDSLCAYGVERKRDDGEVVAAHHIHLPKLVDYDIIAWNDNDEVVARGPNFEQADDTLAAVEEDEPVHGRYVAATGD